MRPQTVHVHGKPLTITVETIIATREWYADNARKCMAEAKLYVETNGAEGFFVNDLPSYLVHKEERIRASLAGEGDRSVAFLQRAVFIQTGASVPLLA